uniref:Uncharacterized protein n=1 Tax=Anopheles farauti TaxID=69004 RepID=A0A182QNP9_9DIPT
MAVPSTQSQAYPLSSGSTIAKSSKQRTNYHTEKALLKEMITDLTDSCHSVTKMLILDSERSSFVDKSDLQEYAISRLTSLVPSVDWDEELENVYLSGDMIVFDVKTVLMKKTIMHMIRGTDVADKIIDYDRLERSEYDGENDDDYDTATDRYNVVQDE